MFIIECLIPNDKDYVKVLGEYQYSYRFVKSLTAAKHSIKLFVDRARFKTIRSEASQTCFTRIINIYACNYLDDGYPIIKIDKTYYSGFALTVKASIDKIKGKPIYIRTIVNMLFRNSDHSSKRIFESTQKEDSNNYNFFQK